MITRACTIKNRLGLHARAASKLVKVASEFGATIALKSGAQSANAKSIMSVLMLQATIGTELILEADGEDASEAVDAIVALIDDLFGEGE